MRPCARPATSAEDGSAWTPPASTLAALEKALPAAVARAADEAGIKPGQGRSFATLPEGWMRQYAGIERDGRKLVAGNFVALGQERAVLEMIADRHPTGDPQAIPEKEPIFACDGGPANFGLEYDPKTREFTAIAFDRPGPRRLSPYAYDVR